MDRMKINGVEYELVEAKVKGFCNDCDFYYESSSEYPCIGGDCDIDLIYKKVEEK